MSTNDQMIQSNVVPPIVNRLKMCQKLSLVNNSISLFVWAAASKLIKELVGDFCVEIAFAAHAWAVNRAKYGVWGRSGVIFIVSRMSLSRVSYESQTMTHPESFRESFWLYPNVFWYFFWWNKIRPSKSFDSSWTLNFESRENGICSNVEMIS